MPATSQMQFVRTRDMYGMCKSIRALRDGEQIGDSYFSAGERLWYLGACGTESTLRWDPTLSNDEMHAEVENEIAKHVAAHDALRMGRAA